MSRSSNRILLLLSLISVVLISGYECSVYVGPRDAGIYGEAEPSCYEECTPYDTRDCVTSCGTEGVERCTSRCSWSEECEPPAFRCDGRDDDCDGIVDPPMGSIIGGEEYVSGGVPDDKSALVWTGSEFAIAWTNYWDHLFFTRFSHLGSNIAGRKETLCPEHSCSNPALVWTEDEYGIVWQDEEHQEIRFTRLNLEGEPLGTVETIEPIEASSRLQASLAWTGDAFGLAWDVQRSTDTVVSFTLISAEGEVGDAVVINSYPGDQDERMGPSLVWTEEVFGLAWAEHRDLGVEVFFTRISADGVEIGEEAMISPDDGIESSSPSLIWAGDEYVLVWHDRPHEESSDVMLLRISAEGIPLGDSQRVSGEELRNEDPALTWTGSELGLAWASRRDDTSEVYFRRISSDGTPLDNPIIASVRTGEETNIRPVILWTGTGFGVLWDKATYYTQGMYFVRLGGCL